jgi:hypothetical protein
MRRALSALLIFGWLGPSCTGSEGTLLVRHDAGNAGTTSQSGAAGSGGSAGGSSTGGPYVPPADASWQTRLDDAVDVGLEADFFYLDADLQNPADLEELHAQGRHYLCYLSAGSWESFRPDRDDFPERVLGNPLQNFPSERWLDVRDPAVRELMARRVIALAELGCDGIPPSSLSVHAADTGFDLTLNDALDYARWLAERIHASGMSAGLAAPAEMTAELWPSFEFALAVDCLARNQCSDFQVFVDAGKPVLHVEFGDEQSAPTLCRNTERLGFNALITSPGFNRTALRCRDIL